MRRIILVTLALAATACNQDPDPNSAGQAPATVDREVYNRVLECSGGISSVKGASLNARIAADLRSGEVSAALTDEIRGLINGDAGVPAADKARVYDTYVGCLRDIRTGS